MTPTLIAGRYEVGELLGRGGMAEVYAGVDLRLSRVVAIKLLQEAMAARDEVRLRFEAEARAAAAITQPHAVAVYDTGEHEGIPFIVMERLPGDTLADRIATGPVLSAAEARTFGRQVLGALDAAHHAGMVHRDVKPGNILLTGDGAVKISDFGIAKSIDVAAAGDLTGTGQLIGTPAYLAPEQVAGQPASPLTDVYALGVVLYEGLTGNKPYEADNAMVAARAIVEGDHVPLATLRPDLDDALVRAVERAMDRDPGARYPSAAAMGAALVPPAVPTVVPSPGAGAAGAAMAVAPVPDATEILDTADLAVASGAGAAGPVAAAGPPPAAPPLAPPAAGPPPPPPALLAPPPPPPPPAPAAAPPPAAESPAAPPAPPPAPPAPVIPPAPLAARRGPSRAVRAGLAALIGVAVVVLLAQLVGSQSIDDVMADAARRQSSPTTVAPEPAAAAPAAPSAAATLAAELRDSAGRFGPGDGAAGAELAVRMRVVADQVEQGSPEATGSATGLIIDVAHWRQAGQLTDGATVTAIQLLQKVPGVVVAGSASAATAAPPTASNSSPEVFVPSGNDVRGKPDKDNGKAKGKDD